MDKELDPHITPEQQYMSKATPPRGAQPKILKTPVRGSPHKIGSEMKSGLVQPTQVTDKAEIASKGPKTKQRVPYKSPRVSLVQPKPFHIET